MTTDATGLAPDLPGLGGQDAGTVLVLRALGLGDALTAVPALRGVRRAWPGRRVLLAAPEEVGGWLRDLGLVDGVVPSQGLAPLAWVEESAAVSGAPPSGHVAVNLHGSGPQSHRVLLDTAPEHVVAFASREAGVAGPGWDPDEHEVDRWCRLVTAAGGACSREDLRLDPPASRGRHVVVHPGAASGSRRWPADRFAAVARDLAVAGHDVVVTGGPDERDLGARVVADATASLAEATSATGAVTDTAGTLDLPALADVVATARLVVCGDTGVAHLATAFGTPSVVLFGPTPPSAWGPAIDPERHVVLWHGGDAAPARPGGQPDGYRGDPHAAALDPALERVTVDEVVAAARALLAVAPRRA
ncbi:glycosyltransferase family 9 protein [Cellulosimicrobium cellulans]|uniref:glycosyltransferase family 9 protein n=1 Tax=Cellulosimicrobium cellulans TaxID=1710 RepID=UPI002097F9B7|nr:glycosyltransferase family 9 protein [Cellulosimicrobium cellulans]MCO7272065.1 glycosyltransferase family 9 protein [Cellulosimicrobium cellulans]